MAPGGAVGGGSGPGPRSRALFERAQGVLPGGVNSPVRAFGGVGGTPVVFERGEGAWLVDVDGNRYVDHVMSWGALIAGHAHPDVVAAVSDALSRGTSFGAPCTAEVELAEAIRDAMPSLERVRMVSSGTEAVMSAVRLARAHTGRERIVKFRGCYHGHADAMLVRAGSGVATLGLPDSPGVTRGAVADTLVAEYNDLDSVAGLLRARPAEVAAVIVEPVAGNMGLVAPRAGFLAGLRALCDEVGALLIFDEVMTGFRVGPGGAQARFGVTPDLTTLGKVVGGGLPVGAFGGRAEILDALAPAGPVYQAGTLSGNPLAMAAGLATLGCLDADAWMQLESSAEEVVRILREEADAAGIALQAEAVGGMFGFFFSESSVDDWNGAAASDCERFAKFFHAMLLGGVYLAPSAFEAGFVSTAHGPAELERFRAATRVAMAAVR
jgi:glutamate-1-semialdehyde 2,1-aminomutase